MTDAFTIAEAARLKQQYRDRQVHIWTADKLLKNYEPDEELWVVMQCG